MKKRIMSYRQCTEDPTEIPEAGGTDASAPQPLESGKDSIKALGQGELFDQFYLCKNEREKDADGLVLRIDKNIQEGGSQAIHITEQQRWLT